MCDLHVFQKWSPDFRLMTKQKRHAFACRNPGGGTAAEVNAADGPSAVGRSMARMSTETEADSRRDTAMTATLAAAPPLRQPFYGQSPGSRRPTA